MRLTATFADGTKTVVTVWEELYAETLATLLKAGAEHVEVRLP